MTFVVKATNPPNFSFIVLLFAPQVPPRQPMLEVPKSTPGLDDSRRTHGLSICHLGSYELL